jgi:riboflavin kinase/FMN adenylyltransferase
MIVYQGEPEGWKIPEHGSAVAMGVFDGVHLGHQRVLSALEAAPGGLVEVAMTFNPHPAALLSPAGAPTRLSTLKRRFELLEEAGIERIAVLKFDRRMQSMEPGAFIKRYVVDGLGARYVAVGRDFRFGARASGDTAMLAELGERYGFEVVTVDIVTDDGGEIRSTFIRDAIEEGNMRRASQMLGRPYEMEGIVVPGTGRGHRLGIPTANVSFPAVLTMPRLGVYAVVATIDGTGYPAVANLGTRPTFDSGDVVLEVHVLDMDRDLYGKQVRVGFVDRIRDERRFSSVEDLVAQIRGDAGTAREILADRIS